MICLCYYNHVLFNSSFYFNTVVPCFEIIRQLFIQVHEYRSILFKFFNFFKIRYKHALPTWDSSYMQDEKKGHFIFFSSFS